MKQKCLFSGKNRSWAFLLFFQYVQPETLLTARKNIINSKMTDEQLQLLCYMAIVSDFNSRFQFGIVLQIAI